MPRNPKPNGWTLNVRLPSNIRAAVTKRATSYNWSVNTWIVETIKAALANSPLSGPPSIDNERK